jgi:serine/threonine protein kinase
MLGLPLNPDMIKNYPNFRNFKTEKKSWNEICPGLDPIGLDLLSKMLMVDPENRISAAQALQHDFFKC